MKLSTNLVRLEEEASHQLDDNILARAMLAFVPLLSGGYVEVSNIPGLAAWKHPKLDSLL